jgi:hypothetical protein
MRQDHIELLQVRLDEEDEEVGDQLVQIISVELIYWIECVLLMQLI